ncbi:sensor domain-containing phosphodiesterase [Consotaella aegiceratis]|uniref:sensor domain-containing phosphodiesterase n=1 Tax=Consotaella aegiceratis TaxID=3097961 RepID=UPI002F41BE7E
MSIAEQPKQKGRAETISGLRDIMPGSSACIERALETVRAHLGMDVAFVSEFIGEDRIFRYVDSKTGRSPIKVGDVLSLQDGYCRKVVDGELPALISDTAVVPGALAIPATHAIPIGAHVSVPLRLADGRLYGTFCCFSFEPDHSLNERDLRFFRIFADIVAYQLEESLLAVQSTSERASRIHRALEAGEPAMLFQPVVICPDMEIAAAEALARFGGEPRRPPDQWFAEAGEVHLRVELERQAIRNALRAFRPIWARHPLYLSLNSSPETIIRGDLAALFADYPTERIVLEITEHDYVEDYDGLRAALAPLRASGVGIAIDDAGSGYASMRHILNIAPDYIKLDISLTRSIDTDPMRRALASALITFASQTDSKIAAEGVETAAELETLRGLGVAVAQGYHLHRPMPADRLLDLLP